MGLTRPVWLLAQPEPLVEGRRESNRGQPLLEGRPLQLLAGPERIESGWWDALELPVARDYFIARTESGALVWIYRAQRQRASAGGGWFLQGRFG